MSLRPLGVFFKRMEDSSRQLWIHNLGIRFLVRIFSCVTNVSKKKLNNKNLIISCLLDRCPNHIHNIPQTLGSIETVNDMCYMCDSA